MSEPLEALARAATRLCLDPAEPTEPETQRLLVYRRMVRSRFRDVLRASAPRFSAAVDARTFEAWLDRWLAGGGPRTRLFWALPLTAEASAVALCDEGHLTASHLALLGFELAIWRIRHGVFDADAPASTLSFMAAPSVVHAHVRLDVPFDVTTDALEATPTRLVIFRRMNDSVGVRVLNRVGALVFDALATPAPSSLAERMQVLVRAEGLTGGEAFVTALGALLAEWLEDGLLRGSVSSD